MIMSELKDAKSKDKDSTKTKKVKTQDKNKSGKTSKTHKKTNTKEISKISDKSNSRNYLKLGLFGAVGSLLILMITGFGYLIFGTDLVFPRSYNSDNAIEETEEYLKDGVINVIENIDFRNLDSEDPLSFINIAGIYSEYLSINDRTKFLSAENTIDFDGRTIEDQMIFSLDFDVDSNGVNDKITFEVNNIVSYSENYSEKLAEYSENADAIISSGNNAQALNALSELLKLIDIQSTGNIQIDSESNLAFDFEFHFVNSELFFKITNLEGSSEFNAFSEFANTTYKIDVNNILQEIRDNDDQPISQLDFIDPTEDYTNIGNDVFVEGDLGGDTVGGNELLTGESLIKSLEDGTYTELAEYQQISEELRESLRNSPDDRDALIEYGNGINQILINTIEEVEIFENFEEIELAETPDDYECTSAELNLSGILNSFEEAEIEISELLGETSSSSVQQIREALKLVNPDISLSSCNNGDNVVGFGINASIDSVFVEGGFGFDYLITNLNSDKQISAPEFDEDITDDLIEGEISNNPLGSLTANRDQQRIGIANEIDLNINLYNSLTGDYPTQDSFETLLSDDSTYTLQFGDETKLSVEMEGISFLSSLSRGDSLALCYENSGTRYNFGMQLADGEWLQFGNVEDGVCEVANIF